MDIFPRKKAQQARLKEKEEKVDERLIVRSTRASLAYVAVYLVSIFCIRVRSRVLLLGLPLSSGASYSCEWNIGY